MKPRRVKCIVCRWQSEDEICVKCVRSLSKAAQIDSNFGIYSNEWSICQWAATRARRFAKREDKS